MHLKGADGMDVSGLGFRKALVDTGWVVSLLCTVGLRKQSSHLIRPPFVELRKGGGGGIFHDKALKYTIFPVLLRF